MSPAAPSPGSTPAECIDSRISEYPDWRGETLAQVRAIILKTDPGIVEEWKWNVPVWSKGGIICTGEVYKKAVKLTFAKGASLPDPDGIFTSSLDGRVRRAIDYAEGEKVKVTARRAMVRAAIKHNVNQ